MKGLAVMNGYPQVIQKQRSFLSSLALGASAVLVTAIVCVTGLGVFAIRTMDLKSSDLVGLVESAVAGFPEFIESLPPALSDALHDERKPDYVNQLTINAKLASAKGRNDRARPVIELVNTGDELVSLLSMRVVVLNPDGEPVVETNRWGATPFAAEDDWCGPLLPGSTRHLSAGRIHFSDDVDLDDYTVKVEITDVRVWHSDDNEGVVLTSNR